MVTDSHEYESPIIAMNLNYNDSEFSSNNFRKRCRLFCVICVVLNDVIALAGFSALMPNNPVGAAIAAGIWSAIARCCGVCGRTCSNLGCFST